MGVVDGAAGGISEEAGISEVEGGDERDVSVAAVATVGVVVVVVVTVL